MYFKDNGLKDQTSFTDLFNLLKRVQIRDAPIRIFAADTEHWIL